MSAIKYIPEIFTIEIKYISIRKTDMSNFKDKTLLITVISGRIVWAIAQIFMLGIGDEGFTFAVFLSKGLINAIPGLILQFTLIPAIMLILKRTHLIPFKKDNKVTE